MAKTREDKTTKTRLAFRGDSRTPTEIFGEKGEGFKSQLEPKFEYRTSSYDMNPLRAVTASWRFRPTVYFPLNSAIENSWIYVVNIDLPNLPPVKNVFQIIGDKLSKKVKVSELPTFFYTHGEQVKNAINIGGPNPGFNVLFANELAVKEITAENVICAVQCKRIFKDPNNTRAGGTYVLGSDIKWNSRSIMVDPQRLKQIKEFLEEEISLSQAGKMEMPKINSGYLRSPPDTLQAIGQALWIDQLRAEEKDIPFTLLDSILKARQESESEQGQEEKENETNANAHTMSETFTDDEEEVAEDDFETNSSDEEMTGRLLKSPHRKKS